MSAPRVVVSSRSFSSGGVDLLERLHRAGCTVQRIPPDHGLEASREALAGASAWVAGVGPVTAEHLDAAPGLRVLARYGVGVDAVDLTAAAERGVVVTHTPGANSGAVADHALALTLALLRGVVPGDRGVRGGDWSPLRGRELSALSVGVVGAGRVGRAFASRVAALGCTVVAHDPFLDRAGDLPLVPLDELARRSDVVSLHVPGGARVVDERLLALLPAAAVLVNTARADLVDEHAVADALRSGRLGGYAADTLTDEGRGAPGPLLAEDLRDRVLLTPHSAAQTVQAIDTMGTMAVADVLAVLAGRPPHHPVQEVTR